jgi:hypothetical protein
VLLILTLAWRLSAKWTAEHGMLCEGEKPWRAWWSVREWQGEGALGLQAFAAEEVTIACGEGLETLK